MEPQPAVSYKCQFVELPAALSQSRALVFHRVQLFTEPSLPLAIVNYSIDGGEVEKEGLRMDFGKRAFLDHFDRPDLEEAASASVMRIIHHVAQATRGA
jgi:hypothetical protein